MFGIMFLLRKSLLTSYKYESVKQLTNFSKKASDYLPGRIPRAYGDVFISPLCVL